MDKNTREIQGTKTMTNSTDEIRDEMAEKYADIDYDRLCGSKPNSAWVHDKISFSKGFDACLELRKCEKCEHYIEFANPTNEIDFCNECKLHRIRRPEKGYGGCEKWQPKEK